MNFVLLSRGFCLCRVLPTNFVLLTANFVLLILEVCLLYPRISSYLPLNFVLLTREFRLAYPSSEA